MSRKNDTPRHFSQQLPAQMNETLGRAQEIARAADLLLREDVRLLTLTGPGGVGKTRLALEIAKSVQHPFKDGVFFIPLAPLREHSLVLASIAQALSIGDNSRTSLFERLQTFLRDKQVLLVLDNFEHVLEASTQISELLIDAPRLKLLVTSREVLHLYGEHEFEVLPLELPDLQQHVPDLRAPLPASIALFVERAQAVRPSFTLSEENVRWVAEICVQVDGLPLAIELAAARCKMLPPQVLLARLQSRLNVLTGGARDLPARQQTLRNTLDWSYQLLSEAEKSFFERLGVLTGSWTIEAAAAIAAPAEEEEAFELLTSLVDKSLVRIAGQEADETRFLLLETIREYALDSLEKRGEMEEAQSRHAEFYTRFAEESEPHLISRDQYAWLQRLDREAANLWLALRWIIAHRETQLGLRLISALTAFLQLRSSLNEVRNWHEEILALDQPNEPGLLRARVIYSAGMLAFKQNNLQQAGAYFEESRDIARAVKDKRIQALAQACLALVYVEQGNYEKAYSTAIAGLHILDDTGDSWARGIVHSMCGIAATRRYDFMHAHVHYKLSLVLLREVGDLHSEADVLVNVGNMTRARGKLVTSRFLAQKALTLYQSIDNKWGQLVSLNGISDVLRLQGKFDEAEKSLQVCLSLATKLGARREQAIVRWSSGQIALYRADYVQAMHAQKACLHMSRELEYRAGVILSLQGMADVALLRGHYEEAQGYYEQSLTLLRTTDNKMLKVNNLFGCGRVALRQKDFQQANLCFKQAIQLAREIGDMLGLAAALAGFAWLCGHMNLGERAAQFLGTADALRESTTAARSITYHGEYEREEAHLQAILGEAAFHENWMVGQTMTLNHTLGMIAQIHISQKREAEVEKPPASYPAGLTAREVDVLRLVAEGLTDTGIARQLVLSPRTVNTHLRSIYAKLGVSSRSAATRFAVEYKLV